MAKATPLFFLSLTCSASLLSAGCSNCSGSGGSPGSTTSSSASVPASVAASPVRAPPPPPAGDASWGPADPKDRLLDLQGRFVKEAANRPKGTPRVEDVLAAFKKAGFTLEDEKQHLASPYHASYCVGAKAQPGIAMSVCEYTEPTAAAKGKGESEKMPIENREVYLNGATTLTVLQFPKSADSEQAKKKLVDTFSKVPVPKG